MDNRIEKERDRLRATIAQIERYCRAVIRQDRSAKRIRAGEAARVLKIIESED